jgi:formate/nitrite transporter
MPFKKPDEIAEQVVDVGIKKANLPSGKMFVLAFLAGVFIAFGAVLSTIVSFDLGEFSVGFSKFLAGSVFSFGLMLVVIAGAELFTGNTLMVIPLLEKKILFKQLLRSWAVVYVGNFIGSLFFAYLIFYSGIYNLSNRAVATYAVETAANKVNLNLLEAFLRAVACNWLVALAIWLAASGDDIISKMAGIYFPIMAFVASGFEHSIANMYFIPIGILLKDFVTTQVSLANLTWTGFILNNLLVVTLGNIIGGAFFVGCIYWYAYLRKKPQNLLSGNP